MYKERAEDPSWFHRVTTIKIDTPGGPIDALLSVPDGQGPRSGVVVVHDAIGYRPDNESTSAQRHLSRPRSCAVDAGVHRRCRCGRILHGRSIRIGDGAQRFWRKFYPNTGHSFANKLPGQPLLRITGFGYHDAAAEDADRRVFAFFNEHLARPRA